MDTLAAVTDLVPGPVLDLLPHTSLGQWLAAVSAIAFISGATALARPVSYSHRIYRDGAGTSELAGRLFGVWNLTSAMVRVACAYDMYNPTLYKITLGTFVIAAAHFGSELVVFKTVHPRRGVWGTFVVAGISMAWMVSSWSSFVLT